MRVSDFCKFIVSRNAHRIYKDTGRVDFPHYDPIIAQFRFCNVKRNDDRVTKWIHKHYLKRWKDNPDLWFALMAARLFNLPSSLELIADDLLPFKAKKVAKKLHRAKAAGQNVFNAAYIVSTNGREMDKIDYIVNVVLKSAWKNRETMTKLIRKADRLDHVHISLMGLDGLASFMAAQIVADLKYAKPKRWADFYTFAASGPGSKRGLHRVMGGTGDDIHAPIAEGIFRGTLEQLRTAVNTELGWKKQITAQDIQNCLCEFDKYERFRLGEGRPKQLYTPQKGS